jgi:hypothetical protein
VQLQAHGPSRSAAIWQQPIDHDIAGVLILQFKLIFKFETRPRLLLHKQLDTAESTVKAKTASK